MNSAFTVKASSRSPCKNNQSVQQRQESIASCKMFCHLGETVQHEEDLECLREETTISFILMIQDEINRSIIVINYDRTETIIPRLISVFTFQKRTTF